jgi:cytochrome c oxidase assembly factor CtaG
MLVPFLAHTGEPLAPHDLWTAWNLDPLLVSGLAVAWLVHERGRTRGPQRGRIWRARSFTAAMVVVAVALVSPLDALASALASAHMVQHVVLVLVAAPLLAFSAPGVALLRGSPVVVRRAVSRGRRRFGLSRSRLRLLRDPAAVWLLHVVTLWFWHAAGPYGAALEHELVHVLEHVTFLVTAVLFWRVVLGGRLSGRVAPGLAVLLVFAMALQSVLLSALMTFAPTPWYPAYATTTEVWHLDPLADQQLAGVIMWVPAGLIYVGCALVLMATWLRATEAEPTAPRPSSSAGCRGLNEARQPSGPGSPDETAPIRY